MLNAVQYSSIHFIRFVYKSIQFNLTQYSIILVQYSSMNVDTFAYSLTQLTKVQYNTIQSNSIQSYKVLYSSI